MSSISPYLLRRKKASRNGPGKRHKKLGSISPCTVRKHRDGRGDWRGRWAPALRLLILLLASASQPRGGQHQTNPPNTTPSGRRHQQRNLWQQQQAAPVRTNDMFRKLGGRKLPAGFLAFQPSYTMTVMSWCRCWAVGRAGTTVPLTHRGRQESPQHFEGPIRSTAPWWPSHQGLAGLPP
jgi:hypothetical protein